MSKSKSQKRKQNQNPNTQRKGRYRKRKNPQAKSARKNQKRRQTPHRSDAAAVPKGKNGKRTYEPDQLDVDTMPNRKKQKREHSNHDADAESSQYPPFPPGLSYSGDPLQHYTHGKPYNYSIHEQVPDHPSLRPKFLEAKKHVANCLERFNQIVAGTEGLEGRLKDLVARVNEPAKHDEKLKVAVVGDAGSGKSAFISALLGHLGIVESRDDGHSCTQVVTEFFDAGPDFRGFRAEVTFKTKPVIREEVARLLRAFPTSAAQDPSSQHDGDEEDLYYHEDCMKTAIDFAGQVFAGCHRYRNQSALSRSFASLSIGDRQREEEKIIQMAYQYVDAELAQDQTVHIINAANLNTLLSLLSKFTTPQSGGKQGLWPLVHRVAIHLDSPLLRMGLTLADLPGLSDSNITRREAAKAYIPECSMILVMVDVDRICDEAAVMRYLRAYTAQVGTENVMLLPTKCETARHNPTGALADECTRNLVALEKGNDRAQAKFRSPAFNAATQSRRFAMIGAARKAEVKLIRKRVLLRNQEVIAEMRNRYARHASSSDARLTVIPTSSHNHAQYLRGPSTFSPPTLSLEDDGIAKVRAELCLKARAGHLACIENHCMRELPQRIRNFKAAVFSKSFHDSEPATQVIALRQAEAEKVAFPAEKHLTAIVQDRILPKIISLVSEPSSAFQTELTTLVRNWQSKFTSGSTFKAFALRNGTHKPVGYRTMLDLNQEILLLLSQNLSDLINGLTPVAASRAKAILRCSRKSLRDITDSISKDSSSTVSEAELGAFQRNGRNRRKGLRFSIRQALDTAMLHISRETMKCVAASQQTAFNLAMKQLWAESLDRRNVSDVGGSITRRRYQYLREALRDHRGGPLKALTDDLTRTIMDRASQHHTKITGVFAKAFHESKVDFELQFRDAVETNRSMIESLRYEYGKRSTEIWDSLKQAHRGIEALAMDGPDVKAA